MWPAMTWTLWGCHSAATADSETPTAGGSPPPGWRTGATNAPVLIALRAAGTGAQAPHQETSPSQVDVRSSRKEAVSVNLRPSALARVLAVVLMAATCDAPADTADPAPTTIAAEALSPTPTPAPDPTGMPMVAPSPTPSPDATAMPADTPSPTPTPDTAAVSAAVAASGPSPDRDVLVALYHATDGPNWRKNTNWLSEAPLGEWHGVATDSDGRVTDLRLFNNRLSGEIPPEIGRLARLRWLSINGNRVRGAIPAELSRLASLEYLWLDDNELTGALPPELGELPNLRVLSANRNRLTGPIPPEFGSLAKLDALDLGGNELSGAIPRELGKLAQLAELDLGYNQLSGPIPPEFGSLAKLVALDLGNNELSGSIPRELGKLAQLEVLDLGSNQLSGAIPPELGRLTNLQQLDLSDNQLSGEIPHELGSLGKLTRLYLSRGNQFTGCVPEEFRDVPGDLAELGLLSVHGQHGLEPHTVSDANFRPNTGRLGYICASPGPGRGRGPGGARRVLPRNRRTELDDQHQLAERRAARRMARGHDRLRRPGHRNRALA